MIGFSNKSLYIHGFGHKFKKESFSLNTSESIKIRTLKMIYQSNKKNIKKTVTKVTTTKDKTITETTVTEDKSTSRKFNISIKPILRFITVFVLPYIL